MNLRILYISALLSIFFVGDARSQFLKIDAIEFVTIGTMGEDDFGDYNSFIASTKNPALFRSNALLETEHIGWIQNTGFALDFVFITPNEPVNEFIFGIQSGSIETEIFTDLTLPTDSVFLNSDLTNRSEFFTLRTGYQRVFRADKRIRIVAGNMLQVGIPVSSRTTQSSYTGFGVNENTFFAKQSATLSYTISYGIRFRLFRNIHTAIMSRPTFFLQRVDGTPSTSLLRGTNLSFQFKIQPK